METWFKTCLLLCFYGLFKELRPSEPFLTEYLLGPYHNLTESEVYYAVYPVWTYSYLSLLIVVFLLTDLLRYKPVIVLEGVGYVITWSLLLWGKGVAWMQAMEFFYGIATSTEVAYYTYIYAQVDSRHYQRVTSYTRAALLAGRFASGVMAQVLYSTGLLDYHSLNYVSLGSVSIALVIATFLPPVQKSIYFHRIQYNASDDGPEVRENTKSDSDSSASGIPASEKSLCKDIKSTNSDFTYNNLKKIIIMLWADFKDAYSNVYLLKWSIWWAFATCINFQVGNYIQPLWESIASFKDVDHLYNGAVEATSTLLGAIAAFAVGYLHLNWVMLGEMTLAIISMIDAVLLLLMGFTNDIWVAYINYIAFRVSYQVLITIASFQIAKYLKADSYGLVFGLNMFMGLFIQSILTLIVIEWLEVEPGMQFVVYGCYFALLALLFLIFSLVKMGTMGCDGILREGIWENSNNESLRTEAPVGTTEAI